MKRAILYISLFFITGCSGYSYIASYKVDPTLQPYLDSYLSDAKSHGLRFFPQDFNMRFDNLSYASGVCRYEVKYSKDLFGNKTGSIELMTVIVDTTRWNELGEYGKKALVYHEAHHCLGHYNTHNDEMIVLENGTNVPKSMMNSYDFGRENLEYVLELYWSEYVNELFTNEWH